MAHKPSIGIALAFVSFLLLLSIKPSLQWRPVSPPKTNPGHNAVIEQSFAAAESFPQREKSNGDLLLPSLQWRKVTPPSSNAVTVSEQNYAAATPQKMLFLPSLRRWRPVSPPSTNSIGTVAEQNFAGGRENDCCHGY